MEGYFGKIGSGKAASSSSISPSEAKQLAHNENAVARTRFPEESAFFRYLFSSPPSFDENTAPRTRPTTIGRNQIHQQRSDGGCSSNSRGSCGGRVGFSNRGTPFASLDNMDMSPLVKSPLASAAAAGAISIEEDVLVMDAITVGNCSGGGLSKFSSSLGSDSGGLSRSLLRYGSSVAKRETGRSWQESCMGWSGVKCSRQNGEEDTRSQVPCKSKSSELSCSSKGGPNSQGQRITQLSSKPSTSTIMKEEPIQASPVAVSFKVSSDLKQSKEENVFGIKQGNNDWSPVDDEIEVEVPFPAKNPPSREEVNEYINSFLLYEKKGKRLPVFAEICPDDLDCVPST